MSHEPHPGEVRYERLGWLSKWKSYEERNRMIRKEFRRMVEEKHAKMAVIRVLAQRFRLSEKRIEDIIYERK